MLMLPIHPISWYYRYYNIRNNLFFGENILLSLKSKYKYGMIEIPEKTILRKIQKVGSGKSFTTTIPLRLAEKIHLSNGDYLKFSVDMGDSPIVKKLETRLDT